MFHKDWSACTNCLQDEYFFVQDPLRLRLPKGLKQILGWGVLARVCPARVRVRV
jgi:hypothetical protein